MTLIPGCHHLQLVYNCRRVHEVAVAQRASEWYKNLPFIVGNFSTWWSTEWL